MKKLILIASRAEAKIFLKDGAQDLCWIKTLENKKGRRRESEFYSDLPGRSYGKFKGNSSPYRLEGKNDHATVVASKFAQGIAHFLQKEHADKHYDQAVIFAPPKLLSLIKNQTKTLAKQVYLDFIPKDIEKASNQEILAHI